MTARLNPVDAPLRAALEAALPAVCFRPLEPRYLEEPRGAFRGCGGLLLAPENTGQVAMILGACNRARVGVVPYGGGTGLVGGQVLEEGPAPVILSLERMTAIRSVAPEENCMLVEAGALLADVQAAAEAHDRLFPLSLAAEGSCRIGGNLATNAGGVNVLRYGTARDLCLGLEAVLADGTVLHGLKRLRKDNTGYDLRHLLIGSEGTLGVITAASLKLFARPRHRLTAFLELRDPAAGLALLARLRERLGDAVSAFELIHRQGLLFLAGTLPQLRQPFAEAPEWCALVDLGFGAALDGQGGLEAVLLPAIEAGLVGEALISRNEAQRRDFWTLRESIPEANRMIGAIASHDIALPLAAIPDFIAAAGAKLAALGDFRINCFGHLGDGNLHYNIFPPEGRSRAEYAGRAAGIRALVHETVASFDGSISAEHGIGRLKRDDLRRFADPGKLAAMAAIKAALDPNGIMNPGAVLAPVPAGAGSAPGG